RRHRSSFRSSKLEEPAVPALARCFSQRSRQLYRQPPARQTDVWSRKLQKYVCISHTNVLYYSRNSTLAPEKWGPPTFLLVTVYHYCDGNGLRRRPERYCEPVSS